MEGRQLGDYTLVRSLGIGALGVTYLAEHRFLKRPYVIKILDPELAHDADFVRKLQHEATWLAALDHPHIVKVHNVSEAEGNYFVVTDPVVDEKGVSTNLYDYFLQRGESFPKKRLSGWFTRLLQHSIILMKKDGRKSRMLIVDSTLPIF